MEDRNTLTTRARARTHEAGQISAPFLQTRRNLPKTGVFRLHIPLHWRRSGPF